MQIKDFINLSKIKILAYLSLVLSLLGPLPIIGFENKNTRILIIISFGLSIFLKKTTNEVNTIIYFICTSTALIIFIGVPSYYFNQELLNSIFYLILVTITLYLFSTLKTSKNEKSNQFIIYTYSIYLILFLIPFYHNTYGVEFNIFNLRESFSQLQAATNYNFGLNRYLQALNGLCIIAIILNHKKVSINLFLIIIYTIISVSSGSRLHIALSILVILTHVVSNTKKGIYSKHLLYQIYIVLTLIFFLFLFSESIFELFVQNIERFKILFSSDELRIQILHRFQQCISNISLIGSDGLRCIHKNGITVGDLDNTFLYAFASGGIVGGITFLIFLTIQVWILKDKLMKNELFVLFVSYFGILLGDTYAFRGYLFYPYLVYLLKINNGIDDRN